MFLKASEAALQLCLQDVALSGIRREIMKKIIFAFFSLISLLSFNRHPLCARKVAFGAREWNAAGPSVGWGGVRSEGNDALFPW